MFNYQKVKRLNKINKKLCFSYVFKKHKIELHPTGQLSNFYQENNIYKVTLRLKAQPNSIMESVFEIPGILSIFS
jgi:hypothetical protein